MTRRPFLLSGSGPTLVRAIVAASVLALMTACGGKQTASDSSSSFSSTGTGSISFVAEWEPRPESPAGTITNGFFPQATVSAIYVCDDYGIQYVTLKILPSDNILVTPVEQSVPYPCTDNQGIVRNVPAGSGYYLLVEGRLSQGDLPAWRGLGGPFSVAVNQDTNVGKVSVHYVGDDKKAPTVLSVSPIDNATNVADNQQIRIVFSERMAVNTIRDNAAIVVTDNISGPVPGKTTYNASDNSATFAPDAPLTSGAQVSVSVSPSVQDMAGNNMESSYLSGFHTRFRGRWGLPVQIESVVGNAGNYGAPFLDVALNDQGDAFVAWQETIGNPIFVYATRYNNAKNQWEAPEKISRSEDQYSSGGRVATDNAGNAIAVWFSGSRVYARRYSSGAWAVNPASIDDRQGTGNYPAIAMDDNGNALVSYVSNNAIYISSYSISSDYWALPYSSSAGGTCLERIYVNKIAYLTDYTGSNTGMVVYSCDNAIFSNKATSKIGDRNYYSDFNQGVDFSAKNNNAVVVWDNSSGLWSSFYNGSAWVGPVRIYSTGRYPSVAMNDSGDIVASWGGESDNVYASHATFTGKQWSIQPINLSGTAPLGGAYYTKVAMDKNGNAIVAWDKYITNGRAFVSKRYDFGTKTWDTDIESISNNNNISYPTFTMNNGGDAVALWFGYDGTIYPPVHANFRYK